MNRKKRLTRYRQAWKSKKKRRGPNHYPAEEKRGAVPTSRAGGAKGDKRRSPPEVPHEIKRRHGLWKKMLRKKRGKKASEKMP